MLASLLHNGIKGPEWLESVDSEELHKSLGKYGYIMQEVRDLPETLKYPVKSKAATITSCHTATPFR